VLKTQGLPDINKTYVGIVLFGVALVCFIWGGLYYKIQSERQLEINHALKESANYARTFEEHTVRTLKGMDQIAKDVKYEIEKEVSGIDMERLVKEVRFADPSMVQLSVANETGDLVGSNISSVAGATIKDREHFLVHREADDGKLFISKPVLGRLSGKWTIQLTRRINKSDGSFGGVVVASVDPNYFAQFYKQVDLGESSVIALIGRDGVLRVAQVGNEVSIGLDFRQRVLNEFSGGIVGNYTDKSIVDGVRRFISYRVLGEYPLIVAVGKSEAQVFQEMNERVAGYYWACGGFSVVIVLFGALLLGSIARSRRATTEQQRLSARLELATRAGGVGVWDYDVLNNNLVWDDRMFALYGIKGKDFSGAYEAWRAGLHPDDEARGDEEIQLALRGEKEFDTEFRVCWPDGSVHYIRALAIVHRAESGQPERMVGTNWDITNQKKKIEQVAQLNEQLIGMLESLETQVAERTDELQQKNSELEGAYVDLQNAHLQAVNQEKMASIGQLAAGVAHEINNPLGFAMSNFETLQKYVKRLVEVIMAYRSFRSCCLTEEPVVLQQKMEELDTMERQKKTDYILQDLKALFDDTQEGLKRVGDIVKALRVFSRVDQQGRLEEYDLNEGLRNSLIVSRNEVKFIAEVNEKLTDIPGVIAVGGQINQVLLNLLLNAAHAIKDKGMEGLGVITVRTYSDGQSVFCSISDNGMGIPAKIQKDIFNPFFTTKPVGQGTGLGLSISYDIIVNKHHGDISVNSTEGEGTTFVIRLPIKQKQPV